MSRIDTADRFVAILAAAKAIYRIHEGPSFPPWEHLSRGLKLRYEEEARAALAAADAVRLDQAMRDAPLLSNRLTDLPQPAWVEEE